MNEQNYTGDKIKNHFTAYLQESIRWKRYHYLERKEECFNMEKSLEEIVQKEFGLALDEILEMHYREEILLKEKEGIYPEWDELSDKKLVKTLMLLNRTERQYIYRHVFEEQSFKEIAWLNGIEEEKVKETYYYTIRKIRKWMGGENSGV